MDQSPPSPILTDAALRTRLGDMLDDLARLRARERDELTASRSLGQTLQEGLNTQSDWVRTAMTELTRLNDLAIGHEARALAAEAALETARADLEAEAARQTAWLDQDQAGLYRTLACVQNLSRRGVPVFVRADGLPAFRPLGGPRRHRVVVVSAPKAGTYLLGEILGALGFQDCGVHAASWGFADLRWGARSDLLARLSSLNTAVPFADYAELVRPGDFVLSHLPPEPGIAGLLAGDRKILSVREARAAFVSFMRYAVEHDLAPEAGTLRNLPPRERMAAYAASPSAAVFFELSAPMIGWDGQAGVLTVRYEDLVGPAGADAVARIAAHVLDEDEASPALDLDRLISAPTLTASGSRTDVADWWSDQAEAAFALHGGPDLNRAWGYPL